MSFQHFSTATKGVSRVSHGRRPCPRAPSNDAHNSTTSFSPLIAAPWLSPVAPAPIEPAHVPKERAPERKPHGYWNDLANVEEELCAVNAALGRRGRRVVPRLAEMRALGRGDLIAAITKHGGVKKVAEVLRWGRGGRSRKSVPHAPAEASLAYGGVRQKLLRRPAEYWSDAGRVRIEIGAFIAEYGIPGVMPTQRQFRLQNRTDLLNAAARHGGLRAIAQSMGLKCRRQAKKRMYWKDFDSFQAALLAFVKKYTNGRMPTGDELQAKGESGLANAVAVHGGYPVVAKKCGLAVRNTSSQGAPETWDKERLRGELREFTSTHYPDLALANQLPTESQLRQKGRNDLSYAVHKFGGFNKVRQLLSFSKRKTGPLSARKYDATLSATC